MSDLEEVAHKRLTDDSSLAEPVDSVESSAREAARQRDVPEPLSSATTSPTATASGSGC